MELVLRCVHAARKRCRCYWALGHLKVDNLAPVLFAEQHDRDRRVLAGLDLPSSWCQHHHAIVINGPTTPCSAGCTLPVAFLIRGAGHQGGIRGAVSGGPSSSGGAVTRVKISKSSSHVPTPPGHETSARQCETCATKEMACRQIRQG